MKKLIKKKKILKSKVRSNKNVKKIFAVINQQIILVNILQKEISTMNKAFKIDLSATLINLNKELSKFTSENSLISDNDRTRINKVLNYWYPDEKSKLK
jgi:hypothetical protein